MSKWRFLDLTYPKNFDPRIKRAQVENKWNTIFWRKNWRILLSLLFDVDEKMMRREKISGSSLSTNSGKIFTSSWSKNKLSNLNDLVSSQKFCDFLRQEFELHSYF